MSIITLSNRLALAGLGALGLAATAPSAPAHAQAGDAAQAGQIVVQAPRRYGFDRFTDEPIVQESTAVYFGDLDLTSLSGARTLRERVVRAAVSVCRDLESDAHDPLGVSDIDDCVRPAVDNAMDQAPMPSNLRYEDVGYRY